MDPLFNDCALVEDDDLVRLTHGGKTVGNDEDGAGCGEVFERGLDLLFSDRIDTGSGLIEDHQRRVFEKNSGDREPLFLSLGKADALFTDVGIEPIGETLNKLPCARPGERSDHFCLVRIFFCQAQILAHRALEQKRVLGDMTDVVVKISQAQFAQINSIQPNRAAGHIVGPHRQIRDGAFAGTGVSDEGGDLARWERQGKIAQHLRATRILKTHIIELDRNHALRPFFGSCRIFDLDFGIENFKDPFSGCAPGCYHVIDAVQLSDWAVEHEGVEKEGDKVFETEVNAILKDQIAADADDGDKAQIGDVGSGRAVDRPPKHSAQSEGFEKLSEPLEAGTFTVLQAKGLDQAVALDVLDEQAVEFSAGFADPLPDSAGTLCVDKPSGDENGNREKNEGGEQWIENEEEGRHSNDGEDRLGSDLGSVQQGPLDIGHILDHPRRNVATLALIKKRNRQVEELLVDIASHLQEDALFEGVVDHDAQAVADRTAKVERRNDGNPAPELVEGGLRFDFSQHTAHRPRHRDLQANHADGK